MKNIFRTSGIPLVLIPSLVISPIWAQSVQSVSGSNSQASSLELRVVEEPKTVSPGGFAPAKRLTVQVRDESGRPVSDAAVAFRLPDTSLSGTFADGTQSAVAYTDASGVAQVEGIRWIASSGSVPVRITATKGNSHAGLLFEEKMSETVASAASSANHLQEAIAKPATPLNAPAVSVPAASSVAEAPKPPVVSAPEVAAVVPAVRPSVSISNFTKSSSAAANSLRSTSLEPSVSISSTPEGYSNHSSLKKWLIWTAVIAAGAGAGFAFAGRGSSNSSSSLSNSTTTIGTPTINIGH